MRIRAILAAVCAAAALAVTGWAQEGHPLSGTWHGEWSAGGSKTPVVLLLNWESRMITGMINPGPDAIHLKVATLAPGTWDVHLEADGKDMPAGAFETVRVQIYPVAYAFRADHRIRLTIQAPGGDRAIWSFDTIEDGSIQNTIQLGASKLVLPVVPGAKAGAPLPACPSNRGQPCRTLVAASNGG